MHEKNVLLPYVKHTMTIPTTIPIPSHAHQCSAVALYLLGCLQDNSTSCAPAGSFGGTRVLEGGRLSRTPSRRGPLPHRSQETYPTHPRGHSLQFDGRPACTAAILGEDTARKPAPYELLLAASTASVVGEKHFWQ